MDQRRHTDVLKACLALKGRRVIDVGCGEGALSRFLARQGATVIGIETGEAALDRARAAQPVADETYRVGAGERLALPDASGDVIVYLNSFHHVPADRQDEAIAEAGRVLVRGGMLCIIEPLAEGPYFELARPVEDETAVRARAYEAIRRAPGAGFAARSELLYASPFRFEDFEAFRQSFVGVDPVRRRASFEAQEEGMRERFARLADRRPDGYCYFLQPSRLNLFEREAAGGRSAG